MLDPESMHAQALDLYRGGSPKESIEPLEKARAAFLERGEQAKAADVANDLGVVYYLLGRNDQARRILEEAQSIFVQEHDVLGQAKTTGNLAQLMNRQGDKQGAEKNYEQAAELFHQAGERRSEYDTYRALSQMHLQRGRWLEALAAFDRGLAAKGGSGALRAFLQIPLRLLGMRK
jgi:tetratricopeptide (TPR) repeat protein